MLRQKQAEWRDLPSLSISQYHFMHGHTDLLASIGICVAAAAVLAFLAHRTKQPLILAYLLAGVLIGPEVGFKLVEDRDSIHTVAEIGLILLLFIIGLEIDLKKLLAAGKAVILPGIFQFPITVGLGLGFFALLGYGMGQGNFSLLYLAICVGLSSTMIVVKLLYDKFELDTLPGRITLGVLVFQDIWAILVLALQPNLLNPELLPLLKSVGMGILLVAVALGASKYVLPALFKSVAKSPEIVLVASLAWCFILAGAANYAGLSREMGALIAGVSISTFPYNLDVIAKVLSIRDFFVTLFFVALGMQIPIPTAEMIIVALAASIFLILTRFFSVFPILYRLKMGHRVSIIPSINLAQISEFAIVIASLGLAFQHIDSGIVSIIIFIFAFTSVGSTYLIGYSHRLQGTISGWMKRIGLKDLDDGNPNAHEDEEDHAERSIIMLGFFRQASALLHELEKQSSDDGRSPLVEKLLVIDFNPQVINELNRRGVACLYGGVAHMDTLQHAHIDHADLVLSTIPDTILKGTNNTRILRTARQLCPHAAVIVAADRISQALELYEAGADFVFEVHVYSASQMAGVIEQGLREGFEDLRAAALEELRQRNEVLG